MEAGGGVEPLIDPEVKAFIFSLVSALGGSSAVDDGRYVLGDDALAVLKDIKRWLRLYDDKWNRLDVGRLLFDANLVKGDLLEILSSWPEDAPEDSFRSKIALLCVDLLTQLTWPIEQDAETATIARYLHIPTLQKAQASYKAAIINHATTKMLRTIARVCLPAMAQSRDERSAYEDTVIKVVLYFFRNIALITQPADVAVDEAESGVDRSTTIDEFHYQDIFSLILTLCSNVHEGYSTHDVEVLDLVFHLVKGVDVEDLFMEDQEVMSANTMELKQLMGLEKGMHATFSRHAPSRHNRFGTMLWVDRDGGRRSTLFGQKATGNEQLSMSEIDNAKKWKRPRRPVKRDMQQPQDSFDTSVKLTARARRHLRGFTEQFLDSSFNPLFLAVRRAIEREAPRVMPKQHMRQYLYLISWFLRAECARRKKQAIQRSWKHRSDTSNAESFGLVASVLNQETFVLLNRTMQTAFDEKQWEDLNAGMKCFTQILLTVQEMSESTLDDDQEIAENILNRIFYEQTTHDRIIALLRSYKDQGFGYLNACTELAHVFLRLLEKYSKENVDMQVRSKRRARKRKRIGQSENLTPGGNEDQVNEVEDVADAQRTVSERKFDFHRFSARFISQGSVDTFVSLLRYFRDLSPEQLKRVHRFFYRVAFKMDLSVLFFRMDIIQLLNKLVKGPEGLNPENATLREWDELVRQVFRRLVKKMQERPALAIEVLFSKIPSTMFYLEHGYDREVPKKTPRVAAELEVKPGYTKEEQLGVAVSILINQSKADALNWVKSMLSTAASDRKSWEESHSVLRLDRVSEQEADRRSTSPPVEGSEQERAVVTALDPNIEQNLGEEPNAPKAPIIFVRADGSERSQSLHQDKYLRLLLSILGLERLDFHSEAAETTWFIPSTLAASTISRNAELIAKFEFDLPAFEDGRAVEDMVRRKQVPGPAIAARTATADGDDGDSEGSSGMDIEESLFPAGGPTFAENRILKKNRPRKRQRRSKDDLLDQDQLEQRRQAKKQSEAEKQAKIKSNLFIRDSDDESDEDRDKLFFEQEKAMRNKIAAQGGSLGYQEKRKQPKTARMTRKDTVLLHSDSENASDFEDRRASKRRKAPRKATLLSDDDSNAEEASTVRKAPLTAGIAATLSSATSTDVEKDATSAETDTETPPSSQPRSSSRSRDTARPGRKANGGDEDAEMSGVASGSDKENAPQSLPARRRNVRAGFIIDSDSDE